MAPILRVPAISHQYFLGHFLFASYVKLRHPCIVTVMGAVLSRDDEPLIVMEHMICGSLYDLIHNETVYIDGEILLPIMRDIASGLRFLHSNPVIHGDIKAKNASYFCLWQYRYQGSFFCQHNMIRSKLMAVFVLPVRCW